MKDSDVPASQSFLPYISFIVLLSLVTVGCSKSPNQEWRTLSREQSATIQSLNQEISRLNDELDDVISSREALISAKVELEKKLGSELSTGDMSLQMQERGLVVTLLDRVLFDSGKAELKESAAATLDKVGIILNEKVGNHFLYVEGHTDNVPIRYSGWRSNWELSAARATEVVHFFIEQNVIDPYRLAAVGYGEFHPVASNEGEEGRMLNRRVEIVISPNQLPPAGN